MQRVDVMFARSWIVAGLLAVVGSGPAIAQEAGSEPSPSEDGPTTGGPTAPTEEPPLAVPSGNPPAPPLPYAAPALVKVRGGAPVSAAPPPIGSGAPATLEPVDDPEVPPALPSESAPPAPADPGEVRRRREGEPRWFLDVGARIDAAGNGFLPAADAWPVLGHAQGAALLDHNVYVALSFEFLGNPLPRTFPFVAEARVGWWETAFGDPEKRGPFRTLSGLAMTYVGWRWVHDHYIGEGGAWAGTADSAGLVVGYTRAAPFGQLTVLTDSQFTLYLVGWKGRSSFPLGLLNQRLSLGWDPLFLDARLRVDPATGPELSAGMSFQSMF